MLSFLCSALFSLLGLTISYDFTSEVEEGLLSTDGNSQESSMSLGWERCSSWRAIETSAMSGRPSKEGKSSLIFLGEDVFRVNETTGIVEVWMFV